MPIKLGIIGYGGMAGWHHSNAVNIPGVEVVAAYDIDPERVAAAKEKGLKGYDTLDAFLADDEVNVTLVATPNDVHCELVCAALNAGKHTICEKPVAMSLAELDKMIDTAKKNNRMFSVHQNRRWDTDFQIAKEIIGSGKLGNVYAIQSRLHGSGGAMHGWRGEKRHGGGMLLDWGVHFIDQAYQICGYDDLKSVTCHTAHVKTEEVEDYFNLIFDRKSGGYYQVEIGTFVLKELPRWMILGDEGTAYINDFSRNGAYVTLNSTIENEPEIVMTAAGPTRTFAPRPVEVKIEHELPDPQAKWTEYYANIADVVDGKAELIVQPWQVRKTLAAILAAFESAKTGKQIELN
ncbi:MAG: Gfo/Idh/MocA family oxidoreductase [Oscillospiraceae bacterium]|jgi:predicted dehydrogenase|nr:Gfo/Idh/MocA family oxidoreductase [Oscillospiraceae bacterium]